jgi:hypothetical protein
MQLERDLQKSLSLSFHSDKTSAMTGENKSKSVVLLPGASTTYFVKEPADLPKSLSPGDILTGSITYLKKASGHIGSGSRPGGFPVIYTVSSSLKSVDAAPPSNGSSADPLGVYESGKSDTAVANELSNCVRDAKLKFLKGLIGLRTFAGVFHSLESEYADYLPLQMLMLNHCVKIAEMTKACSSGASIDGDLSSCLLKIVDYADRCLRLIDSTAIAIGLGRLVDKDDKSAVVQRKEVDAQRSQLLEILLIKTTAIIELKSVSPDQSDWDELFEVTYKEMMKWDDLSSDKYLFVVYHRLVSWKRYSENRFLNNSISLNYLKCRYSLALKRLKESIGNNSDRGGSFLTRADIIKVVSVVYIEFPLCSCDSCINFRL